MRIRNKKETRLWGTARVWIGKKRLGRCLACAVMSGCCAWGPVRAASSQWHEVPSDEQLDAYKRALCAARDDAGAALCSTQGPQRVVQDLKDQLRLSEENAAKSPEEAENLYKVGLRYEEGRCVPKDLEEARKWYRRAAAQGHEKARLALQALGAAGDAKAAP